MKTYEWHVAFRLNGDNLDPKLITAKLAITPTTAHAKGDPVINHPGRYYPTGIWLFDSTLCHSCSLEEHLQYMLDILDSKVSEILEFKAKGWSPSFYCGYFINPSISQVDAGTIEVTPETIQRVANLGVGLIINIYLNS